MKKIIVFIIIDFLFSSCYNKLNNESNKDCIEGCLIKIYIPKTIFNCYEFNRLESDILLDTSNCFVYYNSANPLLQFKITHSVSFNKVTIEKKMKDFMELLSLNWPKSSKIYYSKILNTNAQKIGIINYSYNHHGEFFNNWEVLVNSVNNDRGFEIEITSLMGKKIIILFQIVFHLLFQALK